MKTLISAGLALASFFLVAGHSTDAAAQATRTWVSGVGDDVNPCSRTAPCKTFAGAISKTATNGIIDVLDPGGFGGVTVTKSITIRGVGEEASILVSGTNGVTVNGAGIVVSLVNLQIDGIGAGLNGVRIVNAAQVNIIDCKISGFTTAAPNGNGIFANSTAQTRIFLKDSVVYGNTTGLTIAPGATGILQTAVVANTAFDGNLVGGNLVVDQSSSLAILHRSSFTSGAITATNGGVIRSFGDNAINNGTPTQTVPLR